MGIYITRSLYLENDADKMAFGNEKVSLNKSIYFFTTLDFIKRNGAFASGTITPKNINT